VSDTTDTTFVLSNRKQASSLRTIGDVLDRARAREVMIEEAPEVVTVTWCGPDGSSRTAMYPWAALDWNPCIPTPPSAPPVHGIDERPKPRRAWGRLLRTLGQNLDVRQVEYGVVRGDLHGLTVSWMAGGKYVSRYFPAEELWASNQRRAAERRPDA
jgi:hypothetical protein